MLDALKDFFVALRYGTVSSVTSEFQSIVGRLEKVQERAIEKAKRLQNNIFDAHVEYEGKIARLHDERDERLQDMADRRSNADREAADANIIAGKIRALITA